MSNTVMASKKSEPGRSPQVTVTLSDGCHREFQEIAKHKNIPLGTYIKNILEAHHESQEFASMLRRARKTGDWSDMEIKGAIERLTPSQKQRLAAIVNEMLGG